jgi:hypothetical protein
MMFVFRIPRRLIVIVIASSDGIAIAVLPS